MKINVRLLIITFVVIAILSFSSTIIYYSTTTSLLKTQHSKTLLNSTVDFNFAFQNFVSELDNELYEITEQKNIAPNNLTKLDFIFRIDKSKNIIPESFVVSDKVNLSLPTNSLDEFLVQNPNIILKYFQNNSKTAYFYGKIIDEDFLNNFSEKIRADVALIIDKIPYTMSNKLANEIYLQPILEMIKGNIQSKNQKIFYKEIQNGDFFATKYIPEFLFFSTDPLEFVIFNLHTDLLEFRDKMKVITLIIALSGVLLSFIFIILFTTKIRRQISLLSQAAKITSEGDLSHRVPIISKDELGNLGKVFNDMLENIQENEKSEREYSELITIINKTPQLKQLTDEVLEKIIVTSQISFGVFYLVEDDNAKPISTLGINISSLDINNSNTFHSDVIKNRKTVELVFDENSPIVKTGIAQIKIKYLLIMPVIFNNVVLGVVELACEHVPSKSPVIFLSKIKEQLAIGLNSALSYERLENLVNELQILNTQYQNQNIQISEQNKELINLHNVLKNQAEELEQQRKKAVELSHVKSQFLANMSHELRTPLNSILGLTELIAEDSTTLLKTKDRLKIVFRSGKKLLTMINNILEFSKIESGKYEVTKSNFVLSDFMSDIFSSMEPLVTEKGLGFEIIFKSEYDLLINSDRHKLEQIILNLISNAIKFTEIGGIKIVVSIYENISLRLDVQDTGIGISDEDQNKIFDEFEQVDFTTSRKYQGAGLGLAICKKYVELINGQISVSSELEKGSNFSVILSNAVLEKFTINKNLLLHNKTASSIDQRKSILLIQDGVDNNILNYFGKLNYNIIEGKNSASFIEELNFENIDGIVLNHNIQNNESWNLAYELRQNTKCKEVSLFVLTQVDSENIFYSPIIFDVLTNFDDTIYFNKLVERIQIQYNSIQEIGILSKNSNVIKSELLNSDYNFVELTNEDWDYKKIEITQLLIIDFSQLSAEIIEFAEKKNIPLLIYLYKELIENNLFHERWKAIANKFSNTNMNVFELLSMQITKQKSVIKSTISIEHDNDDKISIEENHKGQFSVMVVDDDNDTQFTVGEILQNIGCEIFFANNGAECLNLLEDNKPDLILLDIMMPIMDGFETIKKIRENEKTKNMKVYAITAQAMLDEISIIKSNGFDDLITKPVNASTLSFKIQQAIEKRV